jgi:hypothetical protein
MSVKKEWEWAIALAKDEDLKIAWEKHIANVPAVQQARNDYELARDYFFDASLTFEVAPTEEAYNEMKTATDLLAVATARLQLAERTGK